MQPPPPHRLTRLLLSLGCSPFRGHTIHPASQGRGQVGESSWAILPKPCPFTSETSLWSVHPRLLGRCSHADTAGASWVVQPWVRLDFLRLEGWRDGTLSWRDCIYPQAAPLMVLMLRPGNPRAGQGPGGGSTGAGYQAGPGCLWQRCIRSKKKIQMRKMYFIFADMFATSTTFHSSLIWISIWCHLPSVRRTSLNISYSADLLVADLSALVWQIL